MASGHSLCDVAKTSWRRRKQWFGTLRMPTDGWYETCTLIEPLAIPFWRMRPHSPTEYTSIIILAISEKRHLEYCL